jgi:exopolyphosphatase/guanosine-5'-triphosphate,3'-diphosphate pyrophosphatase
LIHPEVRFVRIAAIDIGTNSIHMVIASATSATGYEVLDREREVVQIGRGSWGSGRLRRDAIRRAVEALSRYVELARRHQVDHILCTATAAVREARNGGDFVQAAREATGILPRVIPAEEEGRLIYLAVKSALELPAGPSLIVDIGGGSMQMVVGDRERCIQVVSCPVGALRLTEELLPADPPTRRDLQRLRRHVRKSSRDALRAVASLEPVRIFGSSGSIQALAHAAHWMETGETPELINGHRLPLEDLKRLTRRLQRMTYEERIRIPGIDARRAEIIVAGAVVLTHVLESLEAEEIVLSDFGVREGLVTDYIADHPREMSSTGQVESLRLRSVLQLLARFPLNDKHANHVAKLALALFDGLRAEHHLGTAERELLQYAALLHDVGAVLGYDGHGEHSDYIIRNGNLRGLSGEEVEMVATVARFHGGRRPRKQEMKALGFDKGRRRRLRWLAGILRVAEGLDRSHYQLVGGLRIQRRPGRLAILVRTKRDARLELWGARRRTDLLERLLGARVRVAVDPAAEAAKGITRRATAKRSPARAGRGARSASLRVVPPRVKTAS